MCSEFGAPDPYDEPERCEYCYQVLDHNGICLECNYEDYHEL
jgi:hypothetical protein